MDSTKEGGKDEGTRLRFRKLRDWRERVRLQTELGKRLRWGCWGRSQVSTCGQVNKTFINPTTSKETTTHSCVSCYRPQLSYLPFTILSAQLGIIFLLRVTWWFRSESDLHIILHGSIHPYSNRICYKVLPQIQNIAAIVIHESLSSHKNSIYSFW